MGLTKIQYTPEELQKKREEAERKVFALFLENTEICLLKKQNYLFWKCRLKKFNQGEERRDRANAWLHLQPHRSVTFILSSSKLHNHPSQCFLTSSDNKTVLGRFSGLHKLQILDFIFNDPTILGNFQVITPTSFFLHQMTWTSSTRVTMLGRCFSTSKWVLQSKNCLCWCFSLSLSLIPSWQRQPEETEEDRVAHENLKKVKASERSVVAMQAKYKVSADTNTNTNTVPNLRLVKISYSETNHSCLEHVECTNKILFLFRFPALNWYSSWL